MRRWLVVGLLVLAVVPAFGQGPRQRIHHLSIGDPARRDREVPVTLDAIVDTATGETLTPNQLTPRLDRVRLLLVGETHTSLESHRVQLRVIRALHESGRPVLLGVEMFPHTEQSWLDRWHAGSLAEDAFVRGARWYEHWGYTWRYYRDIFLYARDARIPMHAVNTPREVVTAVRKKGFANLTPEEAALLPADVDVGGDDHMTFFKASFEEGDPLHGGTSDEAWKGMLAAQATWDASMGHNAVRALAASPARNAIMVVLAGTGHVAYGVGIERQVRRWFDGGVATLIAVPVVDPDGTPVPSVRGSYANFVWGVPCERDDPFPSLGISTRAADGGARLIVHVEKDSVAARAGFAANDVVLSMDGTPVRDRETLNVLIAAKQWGDDATFVVRRGGAEVTITAHFRRTR